MNLFCKIGFSFKIGINYLDWLLIFLLTKELDDGSTILLGFIFNILIGGDEDNSSKSFRKDATSSNQFY